MLALTGNVSLVVAVSLVRSPAKFVCNTTPIDLAKLALSVPSTCRMIMLTFGQLCLSGVFAILIFFSSLPLTYYFLALPEITRDFGMWRFLLIPPLASLYIVVMTALLIVLFKWLLISKYDEEVMWVYTWRYQCKWAVDGMLQMSLVVLRPIYASLYLPPWFRCLGAKLAKDVEISTLNHPTPDMMTIGEGSFIADSAFVGVERIHLGYAHLGPVSIGSKTFIGNSALVPSHSRIGDSALVGVLSTGPRHYGANDDHLTEAVSDILSGRQAPESPAGSKSGFLLFPDRDATERDLVATQPRHGVAPGFFVQSEPKIAIDSDDEDADLEDSSLMSPKSGQHGSSGSNKSDSPEGACCGMCDNQGASQPWSKLEGAVASQTALCTIENDSNFIGSPGIRMPRRLQGSSTGAQLEATFKPPAYVCGECSCARSRQRCSACCMGWGLGGDVLT